MLPDEGQRLQVQLELQKALIEQQGDLGWAMAEVMKADASSESPLARNARPITVLWALAMITWVGVVSLMIGLQVAVVTALKGVPAELWSGLASRKWRALFLKEEGSDGRPEANLYP